MGKHVGSRLDDFLDEEGLLAESVHVTAKGLRKSGVMDELTMREFDALCLPPVKTFTPAQIKRLRRRYKASQSVFAAYLNTSAEVAEYC